MSNLKQPIGKCKKISKGHYEYRGFEIHSVGYYAPEQRVCWECVDNDGSCFGHSFSKKECMLEIDDEIEKIKNESNNGNTEN